MGSLLLALRDGVRRGRQAPELFWEPSNLVSSCKPCNYADRARIGHQNTRVKLQNLYRIIEQQDQQIQLLVERLSHLEKPTSQPAAPRAAAAIR